MSTDREKDNTQKLIHSLSHDVTIFKRRISKLNGELGEYRSKFEDMHREHHQRSEQLKAVERAAIRASISADDKMRAYDRRVQDVIQFASDVLSDAKNGWAKRYPEEWEQELVKLINTIA